MNIESTLEQLGFEEKEARVYLAALRKGQETAYNLAKESGLKRATVYFILNKLRDKGLISIKQTRKVTYYAAGNPKKLFAGIEKQKKILEEVFPALEKVYDEQPFRPTIQVFEGKEGVNLVYREATESLKKLREVLYFGSMKHYASEEYADVIDAWLATMKDKRLKAKEILIKSEVKSLKYLKRIEANRNPNHLIRFMPEHLAFVGNDNLIYGDKIAIFSTAKEVFAVLIESPNIAHSYRNFFELAWQCAQE